MYHLNWDVIWRNREAFLRGLALGLKLALIGLAIGCVIGLLVAFARTSRFRWLSAVAAAYVEFIRNIPLLLILFFLYFGLPMWSMSSLPRGLANFLVWDGEQTTIVGLAIYGGAYLAEVFRAGILSVSRSYIEAGRSLGLSGGQISRYVTLPIMLRVVLPSLGNTFISLFKDTVAGHGHRRPRLTFRDAQAGDRHVPIHPGLDHGRCALPRHHMAIAAVLRFLKWRICWTV